MAEFSRETSLFCIFHNQNSYRTKEGKPCSHIFSGIVQEERGRLELSVQDFDGSSRKIRTDIADKVFNLAAFSPMSRKSADAILTIVSRLNGLDAIGKWPFYFSRDMSLEHRYEVSGRAARAPEGNIDPPMQEQRTHLYQASGDRFLTRINCVRMALLTAQLAGVKISNIAGVNPLSNTGEEVRDYIRCAYQNLLSDRHATDSCIIKDKFSARKKGPDKTDANFILDNDGLCLVQAAKTELYLQDVCDALARPVQGKSLFNWVSEGRQDHFKQAPMPMPPYLQKALSFL